MALQNRENCRMPVIYYRSEQDWLSYLEYFDVNFLHYFLKQNPACRVLLSVQLVRPDIIVWDIAYEIMLSAPMLRLGPSRVRPS